MSSQFHLRPVVDTSPSSSPTAESSSPGHHSPLKHSPVSARPRRPLSPSSIRDLDLTRSSDMAQRKYPAPPTGHELMAMFPPAPPETPPETRGGPTSGFFQRQERAFFAQAGKELFRVRVEIDLPQHVPEMDGISHGKPQRSSNAAVPNTNGGPHRSWPPQLPAHPPANASSNASSIPHHNNHSNHSTSHANHSNHAATHSNRSPVHPTPSSNPPSAAAATVVPAGNGARANVPNQRGAGVTPVPLYPVNPHSPSSTQQHPNPHPHPQQPPPGLHPSPLHQPGISLRTSPQEPMPPPSTAPQRPEADVTLEEFQSEDAWRRQERMDTDAWRRPMPFAERRRAGKHTKRVIVR
ncbi:hypothetical protein M378DRAFT_14448 [Amanita muscaria Koide BX008]|uniref:Uncharacterized protein n=1 Tax=Amanita muscaria (strain Koide BX008) TaxID=946122 RepID=A0A0C2WF33_AMAMK|nr:hypothetical protein M378DRAFT_14448 [Amanita muscaria Koide BX008]